MDIKEQIEELEKRLEELKKKRELLLEKKRKEIEGMSYKDFMIKCMKEKGGGITGMQLCSKEWRALKGEEEEKPVRPEEIGKFIIIGHKLCPACKFLRETFKEEIEKGEIIYVDAESKKGEMYEQLFNIKEYPYIVYRDKDVYKKCEVKVEGDDVTIETVE